MKKWIVLLMALLAMGMIFWSCSDDSSTEPKNSAPVISSLTASATSVQQGGTVNLSCSASDADGDNITYTWTSDDGTLSTTTGQSTTWTAPSTTGSCTITCSVSDGELTDTETKSIYVNDGTTPAGFVFVQGGTFTMGDNLGDGYSSELPTHSVTLSDFYMGATEVTQAEWSAYMPAESWSSTYGVGDTYPAYYVSWYEIIKYCNLRSMAEGLTPVYTISSSTDPADWGTVPTSTNTTWNAAICNWSANGYRLPSEAEWEYASRGGIHNADNLRYSGCNLETDLTNYAWYSANSGSTSHPVGTKLPNQLGLYDMSGNLWEWCWDWYGSYTSDSVTNPYGPTTGSYRVLRGGYWYFYAPDCRVAYRGSSYPYSSYHGMGFRLSRTP